MATRIVKKLKYSEEEVLRNPLLSYINEEIEVEEEYDEPLVSINPGVKISDLPTTTSSWPAPYISINEGLDAVISPSPIANKQLRISSLCETIRTYAPSKELDEQIVGNEMNAAAQRIAKEISNQILEFLSKSNTIKIETMVDPVSFSQVIRIKSPTLYISV